MNALSFKSECGLQFHGHGPMVIFSSKRSSQRWCAYAVDASNASNNTLTLLSNHGCMRGWLISRVILIYEEMGCLIWKLWQHDWWSNSHESGDKASKILSESMQILFLQKYKNLQVQVLQWYSWWILNTQQWLSQLVLVVGDEWAS